MLDFTSALYLGLRHPSDVLRPWDRLTTGAPAALLTPWEAEAVAQGLAALMGCERATLAPSTLHLFWDLFGMLAHDGVAIYMDAGTYPVARWGVERAAASGAPARRFFHHDPDALKRRLRRDAHFHMRPLVVTDGWCPGCGRPAPLAEYLKITRRFGGTVIVDDTQALGILGHHPGHDAPYGREGGGMLRWAGIVDPDVLTISSLAKGFGVPIAVLAGNRAMVRRFIQQSETRVHCSPPSLAVIHAADHALAVNRRFGDALRLRLAQRVRYFRDRLRRIGFSSIGGLFPVQTLATQRKLNVRALHERLLGLGVRTVLKRSEVRPGAPACAARSLVAAGRRVSFVITARHTPQEIEYAADALACVAGIETLTDSEEVHHVRIHQTHC